MSQFDFTSIADEVAAVQADANVAKAGGGNYTPPPKGLARLRFIGYIELGKQVKDKTGKAMLSGPAGSSDMIMMMLQSAGASLFDDQGNPLYYGDIISFLQRAGGKSIRADKAGVVLIRQAAAE
mgnify:CR=1 FL=1